MNPILKFLNNKIDLNDEEQKNKYDLLKVIISDAAKKLETSSRFFPHFSKHDITHSNTIELEICNLIGEERLKLLSCSDLIMMLLCFTLHDIGMALEYKEIYESFSSDEMKKFISENALNEKSPVQQVCKRLQSLGGIENDYEKSIDIYNDIVLVIEEKNRSIHAKKSKDYICNDENIKKCVGIRCSKLLATICELHQMPTKEIMTLPHKCNGFLGDFIHPRFIASMLCLGDLLDLDTDRFDETNIKASTPFPKLSAIHKRKHESVTHFLVDINTIEVCSDTDDIEVHIVMRQWMDWMKEICDFLALNWGSVSPDDFGVAPSIKKCELLLNRDDHYHAFTDLKYTLTKERMYELLKGSNIYPNKFTCIREIIQNAVDATLLRLFDEELLNENLDLCEISGKITLSDFTIVGNVSLTEEGNVKIEIRDKGIGISEDDIKLISKASNEISEKKKALLDRMPEYIKPSGAFGIGLQSIFMICKKFEIITKTIDEPAKKITFNSETASNGYIIVEKYNQKFTQGTLVSFTIDSSLLSENDINCSYYYVKRNDVSRAIVQKIYSSFQNIESFFSSDNYKKEKYDYIPITFNINQSRKWNEIEFLKLDSIFDKINKKPYLELTFSDSSISVKYFVEELNSIIDFELNIEKKSDEISYSSIFDNIRHRRKYHNLFFYRNRYINERIFDNNYYCNTPIIPYYNWRLNLLSLTSDKVLELNRNHLREDFLEDFYSIVYNSLREATIATIDEIILAPKIYGDIIMLILQLSNQYKYKQNELLNKYKSKLKKIKIGGYFKYSDGSEKVYNAYSLVNSSLYFVSRDFGEFTGECNSAINFNKPNQLLKLSSNKMVHIINHKIKSIFFIKKGKQLLEIVEAAPFDCNDSNGRLFKLDDYALIEKVIRMIFLNLRGIPVFEGYETLGTPCTNQFSMYSFDTFERWKTIELPFEEFLDNMRQTLIEKNYIENAYNEYFDKIINSDLYKYNLDYIIDVTGNHKSDVESLYKDIIKRILELLQDSKNAEIITLLKNYYNNERKRFVKSKDQDFYNDYIAFNYIPEKYKKLIINS